MVDDTNTPANEANVGSSFSIIAITFTFLHMALCDIYICIYKNRHLLLVGVLRRARLSEGSLGTISEDATSPLVIKMSTQGCLLLRLYLPTHIRLQCHELRSVADSTNRHLAIFG